MTKGDLLRLANKVFPERDARFRRANPHVRRPGFASIPTVLDLQLVPAADRGLSGFEVSLDVQVGTDEVRTLKGVVLVTRHDSVSQFPGVEPVELRVFAEVFTDLLLFDLLYEAGFELADWGRLPMGDPLADA